MLLVEIALGKMTKIICPVFKQGEIFISLRYKNKKTQIFVTFLAHIVEQMNNITKDVTKKD